MRRLRTDVRSPVGSRARELRVVSQRYKATAKRARQEQPLPGLQAGNCARRNRQKQATAPDSSCLHGHAAELQRVRSQHNLSSSGQAAALSHRSSQCPYSRRSKAKRCMRTMTTTKSRRTSTWISRTKVFWGGRTPGLAARIPGPHMGTCHSKSVSRRHLTISWDPDRDQWQLYVDSKNGVVARHQVLEKGKTVDLFHKSAIKFGPCACYFCPARRRGRARHCASTVGGAPRRRHSPPPPVAVPPPLFVPPPPEPTSVVVQSCVEIKFTPLVQNRRYRPPRHRRDACSMAWRCRFLTARRNQRGRAIAGK